MLRYITVKLDQNFSVKKSYSYFLSKLINILCKLKYNLAMQALQYWAQASGINVRNQNLNSERPWETCDIFACILIQNFTQYCFMNLFWLTLVLHF